MDIAALLLACSMHADDAVLLSVAYVYAGGSPYAVVNVSLSAVAPEDDIAPLSSPTAARAAVARILASGGDPVLGLLPARPAWATEFGRTLDDLLAPCSGVAIASAKLSEFDYACRSRGSQRSLPRRSCTLDLYGRGLGLPALGRAVVADLTLPHPFHGELVEANGPASAWGVPQGGDLFFPTAPLAPAATLLPR